MDSNKGQMPNADGVTSEKKSGARGGKVVLCVIGAAAVAAGAFLGGYFAGRFSFSGAANSYNWAVDLIMRNYVGGDVTEEQLKNISMAGISSLLDRYSTYYTAEEYRTVMAENSGSKVGIGVSVTYLSEGVCDFGSGLYVVGVTGNSPAYLSGLKAGTFLTGAKYGDKQVQFGSVTDFSEFVYEVPEGSEFTLLSDRGEYTLSRRPYTASYCTMSTDDSDYIVSYDGDKLEVTQQDGGISALPDGAAYLRLSQFYGRAAEEFGELVSKFNAENCTSLILDLRGNGGGYLDVMCEISGIFLQQLPSSYDVATSAKFKDGSTAEYSVRGVDKDCSLPAGTDVYILADNGTASASESLIGVLVSNGVTQYGDIYISDFSDDYLSFSGTAEKDCKTYGKGIMQQTFVNNLTGEALKLTVARIYWPDGTCIHDRGVTVEEDGCVALPAYWDVTYEDEQLNNAIVAIYGGGN